MKQGSGKHSSGAGNTGQCYPINPNFPSQLGSAIDPKAAEKMKDGRPCQIGPTDGMAEGPGANRTVKAHGGQGSY